MGQQTVVVPRSVSRWAMAIGPALSYLKLQYNADGSREKWYLWQAVLAKTLPVGFKFLEATSKPFGLSFDYAGDVWWIHVKQRKGKFFITMSLFPNGDIVADEARWQYQTKVMAT